MADQKNIPAPVKGWIAAALVAILAGVYANEGGYVNDPRDPGGATNYGVTEAVAGDAGFTGDMRDFPKHCDGPADVCADTIYVRRYVAQPGYMPLIEIEPAVAAELVDSAVNFGPPRPSRWFQQSLNELGGFGLTVDGKVGPRSIDAYRTLQERLSPSRACIEMLDRLDGRQLAEYDRLVRSNPKLKAFYKGWKAHRIGNVDRASCRGPKQ